jgi:hypothetical protein
MSLKKGPNGTSLVTHDSDLHALWRYPDQVEAVKALLDRVKLVLPNVVGPPDCTCVLSRVVPIPDKGGKTRHIAIGDA